MKKYIIRSLKYLVYFVIIFLLITGLVYFFSTQKGAGLSYAEMFQEGSGIKLIIFFVLVAASYPALGFGKRELHLNGDYSKYAAIVERAMTELEYKIESQDDKKIVFRCTIGSKRLGRMYEDAIVFNIEGNPVIIEGLRKDVARVLSTVSFRIRQSEDPELQDNL